MSTVVGAVSVIATINTKDYDAAKKHIEKGNSDLDSNAKSTSSKFSSFWIGAIGGVAAALTTTFVGAVRNSIGSAVKRIDTLGSANRVFENMGFEALETTKAMDSLVEGITGLPTRLDDAVSSVQQLAAANRDIGRSEQIYQALNNSVLTYGSANSTTESAVTALSRAMSAGVLQGDQFNTLMDNMGPVMNRLADDLGVSTGELQKGLSDGSISVDKFVDELLRLDTQGSGSFASLQQQARDSTGGIGTSFENMITGITRGTARIIEAIGASNISDAIQSIGQAFYNTLSFIADSITVLITGQFQGGMFGGLLEEDSKFVDLLFSIREAVILVADSIRTLVTGEFSGGMFNGWFEEDSLFVDLLFRIREAIISVVDVISGMVDWMSENSKTVQNAAIVIGSLFIPQLIRLGVQSTIAFGKYVAGAIAAGVQSLIAGGRMAAAWIMALGPIGLIVAAVIAAVALIIANWDTITEFISGVWDGIVDIWNGAVEFFSGLWNGIVEGAASIWGGIVNTASKIWNGVVSVVTTVFNAITSFLAKWGLTILAVIFFPFSIVIGLIFMFREQIMAVFTAISSFIVAVFTPIVQFFITVFTTVFNIIANVFNMVVSVISSAIGVITSIIQAIGAFIGSVFTAAWGVVTGVFNAAVGYFSGVWNGIVSIFNVVAGFFGGIFSSAWNAIKNVFSAVGGFFRGVWDTIVGIFGGVGTAVGNAIGNTFKSVINGILRGAVNIINGFIDAINVAVDIINEIPGVNIGRLGSLDVPQLATGGIVTGPTLAMIGEGRESEAVIPLSKLDRMLSGDRQSGDTREVTVNQYNTVNDNVDMNLVTRYLKKELARS